MKAFVIKNKEGKYWCGNDIFSETIDISKTYICEDFDFISKVVNTGLREGLFTTNCKLAEITIAEGDLEQENKQLKKEIKLDNAFWKQECDSLQEQLAIREKALELACEEIDRHQGSLSEVAFDYFIEQAKENLK